MTTTSIFLQVELGVSASYPANDSSRGVLGNDLVIVKHGEPGRERVSGSFKVYRIEEKLTPQWHHDQRS